MIVSSVLEVLPITVVAVGLVKRSLICLPHLDSRLCITTTFTFFLADGLPNFLSLELR